MTVLLSSHLLHQVQRVCDRVGILHKGRLVAEGTVAELTGPGNYLAIIENATSQLRVRLEAEEWALAAEEMGPGRLSVTLEEAGRARLFQIVAEEGGLVLELRPRTRTLEEIYLRYFQE